MKKMAPWKLAIALMALTMLSTRAASAEMVCPSSSSPNHARQLAAQQFNEAERLFEQHDCRAIDNFRCSYQIFPHPNTLFNMGRTAEQCNMQDVALATYQRFIRLYPDAPGRPEVESRLRSLESRMAHLETRVDRLEQDPVQPSSTAPAPSNPHIERSEPRRSTTRLMRILGWSSLGVGGVMAITGAALLGASGSVHDDFLTRQADGADESELQRLVDRGHSFQVGGGVLLGLGLAVLSAGVVLTILAWRRRSREVGMRWPIRLMGSNLVWES